MPDTHTAYYESEIGTLEIVGSRQGILSLNFVQGKKPFVKDCHPCLHPCLSKLDGYFQGKRKSFSLPLLVQGTPFQERVWKALLGIPYGETQSYGDIAEKIGHKNAFRAVGNANHRNRIAIIIPCHRVIGSDGSLTGYAGGIWRKEWLLEHERRHLT